MNGTPPAAAARLRAEDLTLSYEQRTVVSSLGVEIPDRSFTVIIGPNACGKSTLLKALARMLKPRSGQVYLDGATASPRTARARSPAGWACSRSPRPRPAASPSGTWWRAAAIRTREC